MVSQSQPDRDAPFAPTREAEPSAAGVMKAPCKSCPYRRDVPSGVWGRHEYDKLPHYDGGIIDQLQAGAVGLFMCHQQDGNLCAGWVATHGAHNLLALRLRGHEVGGEVWDYESPVPVFESGEAAAAHGKAEIESVGPRAQRTIQRLASKLAPQNASLKSREDH